jgi:hypothetical protein
MTQHSVVSTIGGTGVARMFAPKLSCVRKGMVLGGSALAAISVADRILLAQEPYVMFHRPCRLLSGGGREGRHDIGTGVREEQLLTESML